MEYIKNTYSDGHTVYEKRYTKEEIAAKRAAAPTLVSSEKITEAEYTEATTSHVVQLHRLTEAEKAERERVRNLQRQINACKRELDSTDYLSHKAFEGAITAEEFATVKARRAELRDKINELEAQL